MSIQRRIREAQLRHLKELKRVELPGVPDLSEEIRRIEQELRG